MFKVVIAMPSNTLSPTSSLIGIRPWAKPCLLWTWMHCSWDQWRIATIIVASVTVACRAPWVTNITRLSFPFVMEMTVVLLVLYDVRVRMFFCCSVFV